MRLPIVKNLHVESFSGTGISAADFFNKNAIIGEYSDKRLYITQRPSIDIWADASVTSGADVPAKGRGVYYWDHPSVTDWYIVNNDKVYKGSYGTGTASAIGTITAGTDRVYFVEMVNYLVILDPENNKGWYILQSAATTVTQITDVDFPGQASNTDSLTTGGAFLDGRLYVGGTSGAIYGSDSNTPVTWDPLNKISAEREADSGVHLEKHHDHLALFGSRTIEFFYNAGNPTGSPLSRRIDIAYNFGIIQGDATFREGDDIYCVGMYPSGPLQAMVIRNFQIETISTPDIESYITNARLVNDSKLVGSGFSSGGRTFYILTFYRLVGGVITPDVTLCYSYTWGVWETTIGGLNEFPLVGWNIRSGDYSQSGAGIMANGDLINIRDDFTPVDSLLATSYIAADYVFEGYYVSSAGSGTNITMVGRAAPFDGDSSKWKFMHALEVAGDRTDTAQTATINWIDGNSVSADAVGNRTISLDVKQKITRMGRFMRRTLEFQYSGDEQIRIEGFDVDVTEGGF